MTMICFFSFRAIVYKILVRTMLLVRADLQRKDIGVFVPLDLRVRFAKEVTITSVLISRGLQQFNGKTLLRCLLIGSLRIKELPLSSCSLKLSYWLVRTEGQQAFVAVSSPTQLNDEFCFFFVISFLLLPSPYSSSSIFFRAALKVERNNSKIHEPQAKVELSGLKKSEYMTFPRLINTACDLQGGC